MYNPSWLGRLLGFSIAQAIGLTKIMRLVVNKPSKGEYAFDSATGVFTFAVEDADREILIGSAIRTI
jgi:hypothetical protein